MSNLILVKDHARLEAAGVPHPATVLRKWFTTSRHAGLIVKVGGSLFLDLNVWNRMVEAARQDAANRAAKVAHARRPVDGEGAAA